MDAVLTWIRGTVVISPEGDFRLAHLREIYHPWPIWRADHGKTLFTDLLHVNLDDDSDLVAFLSTHGLLGLRRVPSDEYLRTLTEILSVVDAASSGEGDGPARDGHARLRKELIRQATKRQLLPPLSEPRAQVRTELSILRSILAVKHCLAHDCAIDELADALLVLHATQVAHDPADVGKIAQPMLARLSREELASFARTTCREAVSARLTPGLRLALTETEGGRPEPIVVPRNLLSLMYYVLAGELA